jgi:hypothetical protein
MKQQNLVVLETTGESYFYDDLRIEAEYDHEHICSQPIETIEEAIQFLNHHRRTLSEVSYKRLVKELSTTSPTYSAIGHNVTTRKMHLDIASDV